MGEKHKVLLPQPIEAEAQEYLEKNNCEIILCSKCEHDEVAEKIKEAEAIVLRTGIHITRDLIEKGKKLKTISRTGAGVDNVDLDAATEHKVIVTSSLGTNTTTVIEHALSLILALSKNLLLMDREMRKGNFKIRYKNLSYDLREKTLGIIGLGRIGAGLAKICKESFDMKIIGNDDYLPAEVKEKELKWVKFTDIDTLLAESDIVSVHVPMTEETRGIINYEKMRKMKKSSIIINTSRGGIVEEKDLVKALQEGLIGAAGLDVFEKEPPDENNPLLKMENAIITPHTAALTAECTLRMAMDGVKRIVKYFNGEMPENIANPKVLDL